MKPGDDITCPHCGAEAFLVRKSLLDGWTKVGEILACSACTAKIADVAAPPKAGGSRKPAEDASRLSALLGGETPESRPSLAATDDEKRFCRDCAHLVKHAFLCHCSLHDRDVSPMDDCPDFLPLKEKPKH
jgi:hypothetical protein